MGAEEPAGRGVAAVARSWARELAGAAYVPLTPGDLTALLHDLLDQLVAGSAAEPFDPAAGYRVGVALVTGVVASPEALGATLRALREPPPDAPADPSRWWRLLTGLATGYAQAQWDRALDSQDEIRRAAVSARNDAVQALHASEVRFRHAALHDPVTGLPNRAMLTEYLADTLGTLDTGDLVGLAVLDVDAFRGVNDRYGRTVGDGLLRALAQRLRDGTGRYDCFAARLDGAEFAVVCVPAPSRTAFEQAVTAILDTFGRATVVDGHQLSVRTHAGVVVTRTGSTTPEELLRAADSSLRAARTGPAGRWAAYEPSGAAPRSARRAASAAAGGPPADDDVVYQPIVALADRAMRGAEAVSRRHRPPAGDRADLAAGAGRAVLHHACRTAVGWTGAMRAAYVSVNIAMPYIHDRAVVDDVRCALDESGLAADRLVLEISETAAAHAGAETVETLRRLVDAGARVAIDGFGTGYSGFDYLRRLPVRLIKLDPSFVRDLGDEPGGRRLGRSVVTSLVQLGHALDLTVIAEGIESERQAKAMRDLGCDDGQGWYFADPT